MTSCLCSTENPMLPLPLVSIFRYLTQMHRKTTAKETDGQGSPPGAWEIVAIDVNNPFWPLTLL